MDENYRTGNTGSYQINLADGVGKQAWLSQTSKKDAHCIQLSAAADHRLTVFKIEHGGGLLPVASASEIPKFEIW